MIAGLVAVSASGFLAGCGPRRNLLGAAPAAPEIGVEGEGSLRVHAAEKGLLYGCAVNVPALQADLGYADLVRAQAGIVVAENSMKWAPLRPSRGTYNFAEADALVAFAEANRMKVRGHTLCWHRQLPAWFAGEATAANARELLEEHIDRVAGRYAGRIHSWDVVNEAVQVTDGRPDGLRKSPWLELIGPDYLEVAFQRARAADPQALLTYNDYGIEAENEASEAKRQAILQLLRRLRRRNVPLDAVGIQSHVSAGADHRYGPGLLRFMTEVRELGLEIFVTEMDVNDRDLPADTGIRDRAVAERYGQYLQTVLGPGSVSAVLTWGITDRRTWLNGEDARRDHLPERCLPFNAEGQPVEAFFSVRTAFEEAPARAAGGGV